MKLSEGTLLTSLNTDDEVILIRPTGLTYSNARSTVQNFVNELLTLLGADTVDWTSIDLTGSDLADLETKAHSSLTGIGTNTHPQIDAFIAAHSPAKVITFAPIESDTAITVKDGTLAFTVPALLNGYNLTAVLASVHTLGQTSGETVLQVRRRRSGTNVDMLSTRLSISYNEYFASDGIIDTNNDDLQTGDQIYVDIDQLSTVAPNGLSVSLTFNI